eukprot:375378-Prymnesium_polylepis.1
MPPSLGVVRSAGRAGLGLFAPRDIERGKIVARIGAPIKFHSLDGAQAWCCLNGLEWDVRAYALWLRCA